MSAAVEVRTTAGVVRGFSPGRGLLAWRGIPYAAPTGGDARFRAPRPPQPWTGVRPAQVFGPIAPQPRPRLAARRGTPMGEDCLSVNVVTPDRPTDGPRPVMVWIHGGGFTIGSSAQALYSGHRLVRRHDVVYVSVNYRLGVLGFLDLGRFGTADRPFDTNLGLRDTVAALEWVRDNIAAFGGDPGNVTVFGESAGGIAVTTLLAVPSARGLFHRAIAQSPAPGAVYGGGRHADEAEHLAGLLGAEEKDAAEALRAATAAQLVEAGTALEHWTNESAPGALCFSPVVDGEFLPARPVEAVLTGGTHRVPLLIGTNDREGSGFAKTGSTLLPTSVPRLDRMFAGTDPGARARVLAAYPGHPGRAAVADVAGDYAFWGASVHLAGHHAHTAPVWMYRLDLAPRLLRLAGLDATHTVDIPLVFGEVTGALVRAAGLLGGTAALRALSGRMQEHWVSFARHGHPGPDWPRYDDTDRTTLIFDDPDRIESDPRVDRRRAWEGFTDYR